MELTLVAYLKGFTRQILIQETGQLADLELFAAEPSPTYLAFDQQQHIYTVGSQDGIGGIAAYQTDGALLNHVVEEGAPHCYVAVDENVIWYTEQLP